MATVESNGVETHYERRGDGPPVVFVHGAIVDHTQWVPQLDAFADEYTVVAYDVRGHGPTGGSDRETYTVDPFAEDPAALVDALDLDRPVVCGLSMGGCIAMRYAARYPDGLSGLVLADTFGPAPLTLGERLQREALRLTVPSVRVFGSPRVERATVWILGRLSDENVAGDYDRTEAIRETGPPMSTAEFAKVIRALASFDRVHVDLATIAAPTLVLRGEHDAAFVRRQSSALGALIPDADVPEGPARETRRPSTRPRSSPPRSAAFWSVSARRTPRLGPKLRARRAASATREHDRPVGGRHASAHVRDRRDVRTGADPLRRSAPPPLEPTPFPQAGGLR
ncbi:alpha/beta fold hydrolase [Halobaculum rubrum]|uniref:alpha/beta fold hydrolase n=1 Tax=Halobaculum rubrum TaxID=2872158 RepID=UPI001CEDE263|nr:alpha/beta hydrolase [Halobaculum rubrum]